MPMDKLDELKALGSGKIRVADAEDAWFVRVDHITKYGVAPDLERICIEPP